MADDNKNETPEVDRKSRDSWLDTILGPTTGTVKTATEAPSTAASRNFKHQLLFKTDFRIPSGATMTGVEVREVPSQVYAGNGEMPQPGTWLFTCDHLDSVSFYVDDTDGIRQSTAVVAKFLLTRIEDGRTWSEVEASQLVLVKNISDEDDAAAKTDDAPIASRDSCVASMIDLDVSIDADALGKESGVSIILSGLAPGAILSAGDVNSDGIWSVSLADLKDLAIIVPDDTPPFDLNVALGDDDGGQDDAATIRIDAPSFDQKPTDNELRLRFSPSSEQAPHRIHVFADGREVYDRVMLWGDDPDIPLDIVIGLPSADDLPFELLIREESIIKGDAQSAALIAAEFNEHPVHLDNDLVRGNVTSNATGLSWRGDLILSTRDLAKNVSVINTESSEPLVDDTPEQNTIVKDDEQAATVIDKKPSDQGDVLVIQASSSDIERSGFIDELGALQSFVRTLPDSSDDVFYERLGLTIKNWRDVKVFGPTNAEVELKSDLPNLASMGGRDNTLHTISLADKSYALSRYEIIEIRGLPPGCLLTHGRNMGEGRWQLTPSDISQAHIIGLISSTPAAIAHIYASNFGSADEDNDAHMVGDLLIGGASRKVTPTIDHNSLINVPLDAETFDPEGHGTLSLTIGDVPVGVLLSRGANHGDGVWTHETNAGSHLGFQVIVPQRSFSVSITCVAMNNETGESTVMTHRARIRPDRMEVILDQAVMA